MHVCVCVHVNFFLKKRIASVIRPLLDREHPDWFRTPPPIKPLCSELALLIIMRGLPGSGKSSVIEEMCVNTIIHNLVGGLQLLPIHFCPMIFKKPLFRNQSCFQISQLPINICSADHFFEEGDRTHSIDSSATREKNYQLCFSPDLLPAAHEQCFTRFDQAIRHECPIIVVDNTNSRLCEYQRYLNRCRGTKYAVVVIEILPIDQHSVHAFHHRNIHKGMLCPLESECLYVCVCVYSDTSAPIPFFTLQFLVLTCTFSTLSILQCQDIHWIECWLDGSLTLTLFVWLLFLRKL